MWKHISNEHDGCVENVTFSWNVTRKFKKPMQRQLFEAVKIGRKRNETNLNTKYEYNGQRLRRFEVHKDRSYDCKVCGHLFSDVQDLKNHNTMFHVRINCDSENCSHIAFGESGHKEHLKNSHNS